MTLPEGIAAPAERIVVKSDRDTVALRQLIPEDAEAYFKLIEYDPDHLRQHGDRTADKYPDVLSVRRSIEYPENPAKYRFGIWDDDLDGGTMVGSNNLTPKGEGRAELGYLVGKQYIGRGYAGRGRALLVDFAFRTLGLEEVYCDIVVGNDPSRRSADKSDFAYVGIVVDEDGIPHWRYALRKGEQS
jgi:RimJ/RimL family protein N-acetyltransferase